MVTTKQRLHVMLAWLWPRRLSVQLLLSLSLVLIMAMTVFSWLVLTEEIQRITHSNTNQARALAKNMAAIGGDFILARDYASIEQMLERAAAFPGVKEIQLCDTRGRFLGDVFKRADDSIGVRYNQPALQLPKLNDTYVSLSKTKMEVWEPIVLGELLGAVKVTYDMQEIARAEQNVWVNNSMASLAILAITLVLLGYILRRPMKSIQRYTEFADRLDSISGEQIGVDTQSMELRRLGQALNQVSNRLYMQNTEMKTAMVELERLASFPENNPNIVLSMNSQAELIYINPHGKQMMQQLGLVENEFLRLFPENHLEIIKDCLVNNTTRRALEVSCCGHTLLWTCSPVASQDNVHCYAHDITEKRQAEEQARKALTDKSVAEAANQAKSAFLANMSHEIRTPLTSIIGFSESLLDSDQDMRARVESIHTIITAGKHLLKIINDILDLSKIEACKLEVEHIDTGLLPLVNDIRSLASMQSGSKGIGFNVEYRYPLPSMIKTDPLRLKQILLNLVSNAIKFTGKGSVDLTVSLDSHAELLHFEVNDTGIGMSAEEMSRLFSAFSQADSSTTRKFGGTGLGLHLSRMLAEKLGGDISVFSNLGKGSCFRLSVATGHIDRGKLVSSQPQLDTTEAGADTRKPMVSGKVLLAEDNESNQKLITHYLRKLGASVAIANNGAEAVSLAENSHYDLILMDMQMPVMDGIEAIRQLRQRNYTRPIVALTANVLQSDRDNCLAAGSDEFLVKPIEIKRFNELVRRFLPEHLRASQPESPVEPLTSSLLQESPDMVELVESFVGKFPELIGVIAAASQQGNWQLLKRKVHDLKSIGGSYGYADVSKVAARIEIELTKEHYAELPQLIDVLQVLNKRIQAGFQSVPQQKASGI